MAEQNESNDFLFSGNSVFVEELFEQYLKDPSSVDPSWQEYFANQAGFSKVKTSASIFAPQSAPPRAQDEQTSIADTSNNEAEDSLRAKFMITAYRERGHYLAKLDPLGLELQQTKAELGLELENFGFDSKRLNDEIQINREFDSVEKATIGELVNMLESTYSSSVGVEFSHIEDSLQKQWLHFQFENTTREAFSREQKIAMLRELASIEGFEQYLHTKFPGAKRFSVEGGEASVVCLKKIIEMAAAGGHKEAVLGMAHRGRLATLTNVMQKPYRAVISEFMGSSAFPTDLEISGDVKYHMGYSSDMTTAAGEEIHLSLTPNPSHLEAVNPVVAGKVRAKQELLDGDKNSAIGVLVHGDTAFCGQGVVAEGLSMSSLEAYDVGGIFHIVINNQIGFTADTVDSRSGRYCTDVAKVVGIPIFHVNGDDIESVIDAAIIAEKYRQKFGRDVVIDIVCYRKYGHNEGDEPMYTQSMMYKTIKQKQTPAEIYASQLVAEGVIDAEVFQQIKKEVKANLDEEYSQVESYKPRAQWLEGNWKAISKKASDMQPITGLSKLELQNITTKLCTLPAEFDANSKLKRLFDARAKTVLADHPVDWATGEQLGFATLLLEGAKIRMSGQDVQRGTFSHRHAVLHSQSEDETYMPLNNLASEQAKLEIHDSNLSEYGVLGFEYGYSLVSPDNLVLWEAQFGDFANGAQIIFDQFIASSETKWLRMSGLVVLLPHAMEGSGPEHSSARLERFLQLAAEDNMDIAYPTTPASIFHLLRRQIKRKIRRPLIIMSPKSLLRHKMATSKLSEMAEKTQFLPLLDEIDAKLKKSAKRIIFCSGKVYYDLLASRQQQELNNVAIIRFEQLYPFAYTELIALLKKYSVAKEFVWCQEEHKNQGAWCFIQPYLTEALADAGLKGGLHYVGRASAASPASGYMYVHNKQQENLVNNALSGKLK